MALNATVRRAVYCASSLSVSTLTRTTTLAVRQSLWARVKASCTSSAKAKLKKCVNGRKTGYALSSCLYLLISCCQATFVVRTRVKRIAAMLGSEWRSLSAMTFVSRVLSQVRFRCDEDRDIVLRSDGQTVTEEQADSAHLNVRELQCHCCIHVHGGRNWNGEFWLPGYPATTRRYQQLMRRTGIIAHCMRLRGLTR